MTEAERIFFARMIPHIMGGKSLVEAGKAVLAEDERLWLATIERSEQGAAIRAELGKQVWERIKAA